MTKREQRARKKRQGHGDHRNVACGSGNISAVSKLGWARKGNGPKMEGGRQREGNGRQKGASVQRP
ncbi:hypothetical protein BD310DRAFT_924578 [Dichomitus squalens]|uniref:Uncharacterized protein n=1 Tax=Dichomitus squalens TaxID=114155 RepID=A0A4Q9PZ23_9APHY|nr:hypothetical protein BD310DRAFT_924578 [Dichomitus squalens]